MSLDQVDIEVGAPGAEIPGCRWCLFEIPCWRVFRLAHVLPAVRAATVQQLVPACVGPRLRRSCAAAAQSGRSGWRSASSPCCAARTCCWSRCWCARGAALVPLCIPPMRTGGFRPAVLWLLHALLACCACACLQPRLVPTAHALRRRPRRRCATRWRRRRCRWFWTGWRTLPLPSSCLSLWCCCLVRWHGALGLDGTSSVSAG